MAINVSPLLPIKKIYADAGFPLRFVGGCVRDTLLGLTPNDIDLASPLPPEQGLALLSAQGYTVIPTGMEHGTFTLVIDKVPYEITTLRRDVATDGRRATIAYTDKWEEDAARRDFTINALYMDFDGTIYDYTNGQQDLKEGAVRFIGQATDRIQEDYLRILRFFRFHQRFSKQPISPELKSIFQRFSPQIKTLSAERITKEFLLLLESSNPMLELSIMDECHILSQFLESYDLDHLKLLLDMEASVSAVPKALRRFHALKCSSHQLRLSNKQSKYLAIINLLEAELSSQSLFYLAYKYGLPEILDVFLLRQDGKRWHEFKTLVIPSFPLNGQDLITIGIKPGAPLGKALNEAECQWATSEYKLTKENLLQYLTATLGVG